MAPDNEWGTYKTREPSQEEGDRVDFQQEERERELELLREDGAIQAAYAETKKQKECNWFAGIPLWARPAYMNLSDPGKRVIVCMAFHRNKNTGLAYPSLKTIMEETLLPRRAAFRALAEVKKAGLIRKSTADGGKDGKAYPGHSPRWIVFGVGTDKKGCQ